MGKRQLQVLEMMKLNLPFRMKVQLTGMLKSYYLKVLDDIQKNWKKVGDTYEK